MVTNTFIFVNLLNNSQCLAMFGEVGSFMSEFTLHSIAFAKRVHSSYQLAFASKNRYSHFTFADEVREVKNVSKETPVQPTHVSTDSSARRKRQSGMGSEDNIAVQYISSQGDSATESEIVTSVSPFIDGSEFEPRTDSEGKQSQEEIHRHDLHDHHDHTGK